MKIVLIKNFCSVFFVFHLLVFTSTTLTSYKQNIYQPHLIEKNTKILKKLK